MSLFDGDHWREIYESLRGDYAESLELYEKHAKDEKLQAAVAVGISRVHQSQGEYDKALEVLNAAVPSAEELTRLSDEAGEESAP